MKELFISFIFITKKINMLQNFEMYNLSILGVYIINYYTFVHILTVEKFNLLLLMYRLMAMQTLTITWLKQFIFQEKVKCFACILLLNVSPSEAEPNC
ncbi:hypothetical protein HZS_1450 [Henneguya salminicola]|nr:hypothetical protein HZS_1450 [Henneguya salminicola]